MTWSGVGVLWAVGACGPSLLPTGGQGDGTSTSAAGSETIGLSADETGSADETTAGEPDPPEPDCQDHPRDLDAPLYEWALDMSVTDDILPRRVLPGGDLLYWVNERVERWSPDGVLLWSIDAAEGEIIRRAAASNATPGEVIVAGEVDEMLWLMRVDAEGNRVHEVLVDHGPSQDLPSGLAVPESGGLVVELTRPADQIDYLQRYDDAFELQWSIPVEDPLVPQSVLGMDVDADGNAYHAYMLGILPQHEPWSFSWEVHLDSYDTSGALRWSSVFEMGASNNLWGELAVGDRVYLAVGTRLAEPAYLWAFDTGGGAEVWSMTSDGAEPYWGLEEIAASPCGGVYVAGRAEVEDIGIRGALWHFDAQGMQTSATIMDEGGPLDGLAYGASSRIDAAMTGEVVAWGMATGAETGPVQWMLGF